MGRKEADEPKLTLQLSGTTFLDTAVLDAFTGRTLYIAETRGRDTYLLLITQDGQAKLQTASQVHWPKTKAKEGPSRIRVQMGSGRWWESEQFLKYGSVFTYVYTHTSWELGTVFLIWILIPRSRKFNLPRYPHQLKWKKVGSVYHVSLYTLVQNLSY
jgi:Tfp pilus assembly protein PilZ